MAESARTTGPRRTREQVLTEKWKNMIAFMRECAAECADMSALAEGLAETQEYTAVYALIAQYLKPHETAEGALNFIAEQAGVNISQVPEPMRSKAVRYIDLFRSLVAA